MLLQPLLGMVKHSVRQIKSRNNRTDTGTQRQRREPQRSLRAASPPRATLQQNYITKRLRYQHRGKPSIISSRAPAAPFPRRSGRLAPRLHRKPEGPVPSAARPPAPRAVPQDPAALRRSAPTSLLPPDAASPHSPIREDFSRRRSHNTPFLRFIPSPRAKLLTDLSLCPQLPRRLGLAPRPDRPSRPAAAPAPSRSPSPPLPSPPAAPRHLPSGGERSGPQGAQRRSPRRALPPPASASASAAAPARHPPSRRPSARGAAARPPPAAGTPLAHSPARPQPLAARRCLLPAEAPQETLTPAHGYPLGAIFGKQGPSAAGTTSSVTRC